MHLTVYSLGSLAWMNWMDFPIQDQSIKTNNSIGCKMHFILFFLFFFKKTCKYTQICGNQIVCVFSSCFLSSFFLCISVSFCNLIWVICRDSIFDGTITQLPFSMPTVNNLQSEYICMCVLYKYIVYNIQNWISFYLLEICRHNKQ